MAYDVAHWSRKKCAQCGKLIITEHPDEWAYKDEKRYFCTWGCLCAWRREQEAKKVLTKRGRVPVKKSDASASPRRMREIRVKKGITISELADRSGISESTIKYIECGQRNPRKSTAVIFAEILGCSVFDITG